MYHVKEELVRGMVWDKFIGRPFDSYSYTFRKNGLDILFILSHTPNGWYLESRENGQTFFISSDLDSHFEKSTITPCKSKYEGAARAFSLIQELGGL